MEERHPTNKKEQWKAIAEAIIPDISSWWRIPSWVRDGVLLVVLAASVLIVGWILYAVGATDLAAYSTVVVAVLTVVLARIGYDQAKQARLARESSQRPWILVNTESSYARVQGGLASVHLSLKNFGTTPAPYVRLSFTWKQLTFPAADSNLRQNLPEEDVPTGDAVETWAGPVQEAEYVMAPGASETHGSAKTGTPNSDKSINMPCTWVLLTGRIKYSGPAAGGQTDFSLVTHVRSLHGTPPRSHFRAWPSGSNHAS